MRFVKGQNDRAQLFLVGDQRQHQHRPGRELFDDMLFRVVCSAGIFHNESTPGLQGGPGEGAISLIRLV